MTRVPGTFKIRSIALVERDSTTDVYYLSGDANLTMAQRWKLIERLKSVAELFEQWDIWGDETLDVSIYFKGQTPTWELAEKVDPEHVMS